MRIVIIYALTYSFHVILNQIIYHWLINEKNLLILLLDGIDIKRPGFPIKEMLGIIGRTGCHIIIKVLDLNQCEVD